MNNTLKKAAEILVECNFPFAIIQPFSDTLEGRRKLDVIKGYLIWNHSDLWERSWINDAKYYESMIDTIYQKVYEWDVKRCKWCLEQLGEADE